jgi:hypothetical protein
MRGCIPKLHQAQISFEAEWRGILSEIDRGVWAQMSAKLLNI